jgi:NAD(P)-dependent dehydrogenase (short-subunit alcohol dehydrogenase family)
MTADPGTGRCVIVTGAGSGIGRAAAQRFADAGDHLVVTDIDVTRAESVASEINAAGGKAVAVTGDLGRAEVIENVVATAVKTFGGVDVLVNNAGILDMLAAPGDTTDEEWMRVLHVNLTAPFMLTRAALPYLLKSSGAAIVFTASEASFRGAAAGAAYTASKHGVVGLAKSLAIMYRDRGIRTNVIAPGGTRTNLQLVDPNARPSSDGTAVLARYNANQGRMADPDEPAAAIFFLASPAASGINGAILPVDDGWCAV